MRREPRLLSWFAVHPPERVTIVAFFLGASSIGPRQDFIPTVMKQLDGLKLNGVQVPDLNTADSVDLWAALDQAAHACRRDGQRLVLVVDGLDEDVDGRRIAGLLPGELQGGMRVVVSSRPQEQVLNALLHDLGHPLHNPDIVRELEPSPHAKAEREIAALEIERLAGSEHLAESRLMALITAASGTDEHASYRGGGLTAASPPGTPMRP